MGSLDRFLNPVWYRATKLDSHRQLIIAIVIGSYGFCRQYVHEELISPLQSFLGARGLENVVTGGNLTADIETALTDEALVALLRSCMCPTIDPSGKLPSRVLQSLPGVWGTFVLADINYRLTRNSPTTLDETPYSKDPNEARVQMLTKWMQILGVSTPSFATRLNASGFAGSWDGLSKTMMSGMLTGLSRTPDDALILTGRRVASEVPAHRRVLTEYFIDRLAKSSLDEKDSMQPKIEEPPHQRSAAVAASPQQQRVERVLVVDDEKAIREIISSILTSAGYGCHAVAGGLEALALFESGEKFDLLITDLLNSPLDGLSLLERTRKRFPNVVVVVASAVHDDSVAEQCIRNGAYEYLREPFERKQLLAVVASALEHRRRELA
jgi:CheY-like chemotaxis protein